jgi:enoyl-[acyl-carrier protein] reductase II
VSEAVAAEDVAEGTAGPPPPIRTRVSELLGIRYPIVQAPMGWIARAQLASAVSNAGGLGIIETSSGELDAVREEIRKMRDLTEEPFGVNIAQLFVRDPSIVDFVVDQGVRFVTTSAGDPNRYTRQLKEAGLTVFHVVPTLAAAHKAVDAGVDGLVVEGGEGGGFKNPRDVASMVLLPLVTSRVDVPVIAAGGICDGRTMAASMALGAEGVQMGTRMVSAAESPVHDNWKQAIVAAAETDTVFLNRFSRPGLRALRTARTTELEREDHVGFEVFGSAMDLYFGGDPRNGAGAGGNRGRAGGCRCGHTNSISRICRKRRRTAQCRAGGLQTMNITVRKILLWLVIAFIILFIWNDPAGAGDAIGNFLTDVGDFFSDLFNKFADFVSSWSDESK